MSSGTESTANVMEITDPCVDTVAGSLPESPDLICNDCFLAGCFNTQLHVGSPSKMDYRNNVAVSDVGRKKKKVLSSVPDGLKIQTATIGDE